MPTARTSRIHPAPPRAGSTDATRSTASPEQGNGHNMKSSVPLESVVITAELAQRPSRRPQLVAENRILLALAQDIADSPECVFEKLARGALELCHAHSAGFTVLEENANIFRWRAVAGQWASHTGEVASVDFAICSTVLERRAAQLFRHPERHFTYLAAIIPPIEESLLVPFYSKGKLAGALWVLAHDESRRFDAEDLRIMTNLAVFASAAFQIVRAAQADEQERTRELQQQIHETKRAEGELRAVTARLFKVQDEERRYVARELHAGASQTLAALSMNVGRISQNAARPDTLFEVVHQCQTLIANLTREIRTISYLLHPPLLEDLGLAFALRIYAQGFSERSGIRVQVEEDKSLERLPKDSEIAVFRVIQESLTNIHRHSGASSVNIRVSHSGAGLHVEITDDGKGISAEKQRELAQSAKSGVGILGMRERIRQLGGTFEITSGIPVASDNAAPGVAAAFSEAFSLNSGAASGAEERGKRRGANPGTCVSVTLPLSNAATA